MPYNSVLGRACKPRLAPAITVAILTILCAPAAKAQVTTWTIAVSNPSSGTKPKYVLSCQQAGTTVPCPNLPDPTLITVNRTDLVYWQIDSTSNLELWIVHEDAIVDDRNNKATHLHHTKKGDGVERDGGHVDVNAPISTTQHKYYVFAQDLSTKILYYDDPRIIIGGTGLQTSLSAIEMKCEALFKKLEGPNAEDAGNLCQQIKALEESLGSKKEK